MAGLEGPSSPSFTHFRHPTANQFYWGSIGAAPFPPSPQLAVATPLARGLAAVASLCPTSQRRPLVPLLCCRGCFCESTSIMMTMMEQELKPMHDYSHTLWPGMGFTMAPTPSQPSQVDDLDAPDSPDSKDGKKNDDR